MRLVNSILMAPENYTIESDNYYSRKLNDKATN